MDYHTRTATFVRICGIINGAILFSKPEGKPMTFTKTIFFICCIFIASIASAQIDPDPDGIGVYFDEGATEVAITAPVGEPVTAYLIATNPSHAGTLALWEASVGTSVPVIMTGHPTNAFNMASNMPGSPGFSFACAVYQPYPDLQPIMILATLEINVGIEGPIEIFVGGYTFDWPMYRPDDFEAGPDIALFQSSGSPEQPVAVINGPVPVATESQSWDGVKSLYRQED